MALPSSMADRDGVTSGRNCLGKLPICGVDEIAQSEFGGLGAKVELGVGSKGFQFDFTRNPTSRGVGDIAYDSPARNPLLEGNFARGTIDVNGLP